MHKIISVTENIVQQCVKYPTFSLECNKAADFKYMKYRIQIDGSESGFADLEVACRPLVPKFAGSNPTEAVGFFRAKKSSARLPSEGN